MYYTVIKHDGHDDENTRKMQKTGECFLHFSSVQIVLALRARAILVVFHVLIFPNCTRNQVITYTYVREST